MKSVNNINIERNKRNGERKKKRKANDDRKY